MTPAQWNEIRNGYAVYLPYIMERSALGQRVSPYFIDWAPLFTPIEMAAWFSIRGRGVPLYPQFPVLNYFIDFANPYKKIGLELDGAAFHDPERDLKRDIELVKQGWKIFRVSGAEAFHVAKGPYDFEEHEEPNRDSLSDWLYGTVDGVVTAINEVYFRGNRNGLEGGYVSTLDAHRLVNFDLLAGVR